MRYPFNFVGYIDDQEQEILNELVAEIDEDEDAVNLMFGHYPTSVVKQSSFIRLEMSKMFRVNFGYLFVICSYILSFLLIKIIDISWFSLPLWPSS